MGGVGGGVGGGGGGFPVRNPLDESATKETVP